MLYKEFEKNREDILENEFCMQSNASTLPITDCPNPQMHEENFPHQTVIL